MNVHITYKAAKAPDLEKEFAQHIDKLKRRLHVFRPELIHLHGSVEQNSPREGVSVALNLRLPSGQMAAQKAASTAVAACKAAFAELLSQVTRHKELLREQHKKRRRQQLHAPGVAFEKTLAAVHAPLIRDADINSYVNANLRRLENFIARELRYREASGQFRPGLVSQAEVVDEVIARALGDDVEKPELLSLERWLYRLALQSIDSLEARNGDGEVPLFHLEQSARKQNVTGSDEPLLQYHQPDEALQGEDVIADRRSGTPEEIAASDEMVAQLERVLHNARREEREAFILYVIEGFTVNEIAQVTERPAEQVRAAIQSARDAVMRKLPAANALKEKLLQHSRIA